MMQPTLASAVALAILLVVPLASAGDGWLGAPGGSAAGNDEALVRAYVTAHFNKTFRQPAGALKCVHQPILPRPDANHDPGSLHPCTPFHPVPPAWLAPFPHPHVIAHPSVASSIKGWIVALTCAFSGLVHINVPLR